MAVKGYTENVFINCPFDDEYYELLYAAVFTVFDCGFVARCSLEEDDGGDVRIDKINRIISHCKYGIHDISRTDLDSVNNLPRFNMPLELGLFLGARKFGNSDQIKKTCLILDSEQYRYQKFISDLAGQDIRAHRNEIPLLIKSIRNWLQTANKGARMPSGSKIEARYYEFINDLPELCKEANQEYDELIYNDFTTFVSYWLEEAAS